jgi:hypothetical protein
MAIVVVIYASKGIASEAYMFPGCAETLAGVPMGNETCSHVYRCGGTEIDRACASKRIEAIWDTLSPKLRMHAMASIDFL